MLKRCFDVLASLTALMVLWPLFLIISICIKIDSKGPVFYRQQRVGLYGELFLIHKFRTMHVKQSYTMQITVGDDIRITRFGKFLRKYKLDELPQLLDVLLGKMSLVGPRPEVPQFMDYYPKEIRDKVLSVRPGITDLAAIEMIDENKILAKYPDPEKAYVSEILPLKQEFYLQYIEQRTFFMDIKIILLTCFKVFFRS